MDVNDIRLCANYYQENFLETFYIVSTYSGKSFILIGEKSNFPHLVGIDKSIYNSNGYRSPKTLYRDIIIGKSINFKIVPRSISTTSKMFKKVMNFRNMTDLFWDNKGALAVNYNSALSATQLNNVDILLSDLQTGYMLGWKMNNSVPINAEIKLQKYCISSWIDESNGSQRRKEKYMPNQDIDIIRYVLSFDKNSNLIRKKEYKFNSSQKVVILNSISNNSSNLLLDSHNERYYVKLAKSNHISCQINGKQQ
jgi:hypothetical protein